jgi:carbon monoxide dehydrogenase subunit G
MTLVTGIIKNMKISGAKVTTTKSAQEMFEFLTQLENFEQLMPESIQKFLVEGESFLFALKGMPEIRLVLKEKTEFSKVVLGAASSKLSFSLIADIEAVSDTSSEVELNFEGKFNPMMAMMVKKPLTSFINTLTDNISKL